ncbi:MAG: SPOR domain-containing protein [Weeksellaceae bacterium]
MDELSADKQMLTVVHDSVNGGSFIIRLDSKLKEFLIEKENCTPPKGPSPSTPLTPEERCAKQNKIMGYKIQIFYTKDRNAAEKVRSEFADKYPDLTPELVYASPDYRILVGDYFTRNSAASDLRRIRRNYPGSFAVQWRVWCRKAH